MGQFQKTIEAPVTVSGVGLHTGLKVNLTFRPAPANHGYLFKRIDLPGCPVIRADVDNVVDVSRGTTLEEKGARVSTVEHVLAALVGLEVDNVMMELDAAEMPIMDGSSLSFVDALLEAGIVDQDANKEYYYLTSNIYHRDQGKNVEMMAVPADDYQLTVMVDYNSKVLGKQIASVNHITEFKDEIAEARTFCFLHELQLLLDNNLIKGGDLNNAIVVVDRMVSEEELKHLAKYFDKPDIEVKQEGILNNIDLRYPNEPARHKLLDVVGDLALIGTPIKAKIYASRPGHSTNIEFARKIKNFIKASKTKNQIPNYDPNKVPVMDIRAIERSLPHKYPFLLIDKIIELSDKQVVGIKNVTFNENYFQGHFPGNPVMPGVLQLEAMAQAGGILLLRTVTDPENWDTYFLKIDNARFKNKVVPGDTLILKLELLNPIRRGLCEMRGTAFVGNKVVTEADLVAKIVRKEGK